MPKNRLQTVHEWSLLKYELRGGFSQEHVDQVHCAGQSHTDT